MMKCKQLVMSVPLVFTIVLLAACDGGLSAGIAPATAQPGATSKPGATENPGSTQAPAPTPIVAATATPEVATITAPTAAPSLKEPAKSSALFTAIQKVVGVKSYRADLEMKGKGFLGLSGDDTKPDPETVLINLKGDVKGATDRLAESVAIRETADSLRDLGTALLAGNDLPGAIKRLGDSARLNERDATTWSLLSQAYLMDEAFESAETAARTSLAIQQAPATTVRLAQALNRQKKFKGLSRTPFALGKTSTHHAGVSDEPYWW